MGRVLAEGVQRVLETLEYSDNATVDWRLKRLPIPLRELPAEELARVRGIIEGSPEPEWANDEKTAVTWEWMQAASRYSLALMRRRGPCLDYELQVLRLGDAAIVGLPGEPFVEGQLQVKTESPTYPTYVAHATSHYVGYIPTRDALQRGGHEVNTSFWAKLAPEALEMVVAGAGEALREMW